MSATGLDTFDTTVQETHHWPRIMMGELGTDDRRIAVNALRAALQALRDRVGLENAVHLGAQLPMLLRGAYCEGWHPAGTPTHERHLAGSSTTSPHSCREEPPSIQVRPHVPALP